MKGKFITTDIRLACLSAQPKPILQSERNEALPQGVFEVIWTKVLVDRLKS